MTVYAMKLDNAAAQTGGQSVAVPAVGEQITQLDMTNLPGTPLFSITQLPSDLGLAPHSMVLNLSVADDQTLWRAAWPQSTDTPSSDGVIA